MDDVYSSRYAELYRSHWWWRAREALVARKVADLAPAAGWERALDVGCGDGLFLSRLSRFADTVEGLEVDDRLVSTEVAKQYPIHIGALDRHFEPPAPYDFISMLDVLEHVERPLQALRRCKEIMATGGVLLLTVPAFQMLWTSHDELNRHYLRYTRRELIRQLSEAGFEILESRYFFHWLVLPKWFIARTERLLGRRIHDPTTPPRIVNQFLQTFSRAEQVVLRRLGWVPGTSILLTATPRH